MSRIELLDFQQEAASKLVETAVSYYEHPDMLGGRPVPFVGQLKAVTGGGKTPILADVVGRLKPAIILWTTKFGAVVDQTVTNLQGKYRHLVALLHDSTAARVGALFQLLVQDTTAQDFGLPSSAIRLRM